MQLQPISRIAPFVADAPYLARQGDEMRGQGGTDRRAERARRATERRELLALGDACWRDLGIGRALEEPRKSD